MQLLFMKDQDVVQTLSPNASQKSFTDRIRSRRMIRCFQYLDATCDCYASETGSEFTIMIVHEIFRRVSIWSRLPQLLFGPSAGRRARHPDMDHFARLQLNDEERKKRAEKEVSHLEEI